MRVRLLTAVCVLVGGAGLWPAPADEPPPPRAVPAPGGPPPGSAPLVDRAELDRRMARVAYDTALLGTKLWEGGNHEGCFRLYQGALTALLPMLDGHPDLAMMVRDRLEKANALDPIKGAFALREALDAVQKETALALGPQKPLWDRLGGEKVVRALFRDILAAATTDPKVNFDRGGKYKLDAQGLAKLEQSMVEWFSQEAGGPLKYTGRDMKAAHAGMKITDAEFRALLPHVVNALKKNKVPLELMVNFVEVLGKSKLQVVGQ